MTGLSRHGGVMLLLKTSTAAAHEAAERHRFQRALLTGRLGRDAYAALLGQMLLVHAALDAALERASAADARIAAVFRDHHRRVEIIHDDLRVLGVDPSAAPRALAATRAAVADIAAAEGRSPLTLLGFLYVLEGATNGGRFIARAVRTSLNLTPGRGDRYQDPYGDDHPRLWAEFKATMDALELSDAERERLVDAARGMFDHVRAIAEDLSAAIELPE